MAKQSKRTRKFVSSGGVKGRLRMGTITNKGVFKRKVGGKSDDRKNITKRAKLESDGGSYLAEQKQKREDADFVSEKNFGDLDIESFFEAYGEREDIGDNEDEVAMSDDDDDDDDDQHRHHLDQGDRKTTTITTKLNSRKSTTTKQDIPKESPKTSEETKHSSDSSSDSEEEDVEKAERHMKEEMGKLQDKDPEFHQFLKENEETLLDFGVSADEEEDDDDNHDDDDDYLDDMFISKKPKDSTSDGDAKLDTMTNRDGTVQLTIAMMEKLERGAFESHGVKALKRVVNAFKSACHLADDNVARHSQGKGPKYSIHSSDVFDRLMVLSLTKCHEEFYYHLLGKGVTRNKTGEVLEKRKKMDDDEHDSMEDNECIENGRDPNKPINPKLLERAGRWDDLKPILFAFVKSTMHILSEAKDPELVVFVLKALSNYVPYMTPFPRLSELMLKTLTDLWSAPMDSSEDYQVVRLHSFLRIRQLAMTQPFPFIEESLKKLYLAYAQRAKFATASSVTSVLPTLTFMGNCVVELYSLDYHSSYQHAFIYIRQLALHLRTAMHRKTADALAAVYCWQFLHCLKLWVAVLTESCQTEHEYGILNNGEERLLRSLIFPLSHIILGTARLIPSTRYLPLRLHCVRLLQQLAAAAEIFLPTTSILLDVFDLNELSQPPKKVDKCNIQPLALTLKLRADNPLRSMEEMEICLAEVFALLSREIDLYRFSAGFPEFSVRINQRLKKVSSYYSWWLFISAYGAYYVAC